LETFSKRITGSRVVEAWWRLGRLVRVSGYRPGMRIAAVVLLLALSACTPDPGSPAAPGTDPDPPALSAIDTTRVSVARAPFCDRVSDDQVTAALGRTGAKLTAWGNGDRLPSGGKGDVANEYGCRWQAGRTTALAWVFAPPVDPAKAHQLVSDAKGMKCARLRDAPAFGSPTFAVRCDLNAPTTIEQLSGLFGDAWLTCSLVMRRGSVPSVGQLSNWCAAVLAATTD